MKSVRLRLLILAHALHLVHLYGCGVDLGYPCHCHAPSDNPYLERSGVNGRAR